MNRMIGPAHRREFLRMLDEELKEEISVVRRMGYLQALERAPALPTLGEIERQVRLDTSLNERDRSLLLSTLAKKLTGA
jgi:hypothetical protein